MSIQLNFIKKKNKKNVTYYSNRDFSLLILTYKKVFLNF